MFINSIGYSTFTIAMACSSCHLFSHSFTCINDNLVKNSRILEKPTNFVAFSSKPRLNSAVSTAEITGNVQEIEETKERPKFRWVEINPGSIIVSQKLAISNLPRKMERICKALMRQIICFSPQKGSLSELLTAWVKIMKPRRADWLVVFKELSYIDHPFYMQASII